MAAITRGEPAVAAPEPPAEAVPPHCAALKGSLSGKVPILTVPSTVKAPPLSSTEIRPVESVANVTRNAVASTPAPIGGAVPTQSTLRFPPLSVTGWAACQNVPLTG